MKTYEKEKYIGTYPLTYDSGIGVIRFEHDVEDYVVYQLFHNGVYERPGKRKIDYSRRGESYFRIGLGTFYLSDFLKVHK